MPNPEPRKTWNGSDSSSLSLVRALRTIRKSVRSYLCHEGSEGSLTVKVTPYIKFEDPAEVIEKAEKSQCTPMDRTRCTASSSAVTDESTSIVSRENSDPMLKKVASVATFQFFVNDYIRVRENVITVKSQFQQLITDKDLEVLPKLEGKEGDALDEQAVQLIFYLCDKLRVTNVEKYHSLHIYDRWILSLESKVKDSNPFGRGRQQQLSTVSRRWIIQHGLLGIAVCVQLASKNVGRITYVSPTRVAKVLTKIGVDVDLETVNKLELDIFLSVNINIVTPLEVVDHILALLGNSIEEYRQLYGICLMVLDFFYLRREAIFKEIMRLFDISELDYRVKNDYVYHGAAVVLTAYKIRQPMFSDALLPKLESFVGLTQEDILRLSESILLTLDA